MKKREGIQLLLYEHFLRTQFRVSLAHVGSQTAALDIYLVAHRTRIGPPPPRVGAHVNFQITCGGKRRPGASLARKGLLLRVDAPHVNCQSIIGGKSPATNRTQKRISTPSGCAHMWPQITFFGKSLGAMRALVIKCRPRVDAHMLCPMAFLRKKKGPGAFRALKFLPREEAHVSCQRPIGGKSLGAAAASTG